MSGIRPGAYLVNPCFAMSKEAVNTLATDERRALDALLEHRGTDDDCGCFMSMIEIAIRAIAIARKHRACRHLDLDGLAQADRVMHRAGHALHAGKARQAQHGRIGFDAAERQALIDAEAVNADLHKPGVILRLVWGVACREAACDRLGVKLMPLEACQ